MSEKYKVCPECRGEGFVSKIKEAFTYEEAEDQYGPEVDEFFEEYTKRGGAYDESCPLCTGRCVCTAAQLRAWRELQEYDAERNAEIRAGC